MSSRPPSFPPSFLADWSARHAAAGAPAPASGATAPASAIAVEDHLAWSRTIADTVRRAFNFPTWTQEILDLEQVAALAVVELARRFDPSRVPSGGDPVRAFRGWAALEVRKRCQREAVRLRNGGTFHTRRETGRAPTVLPLESWMKLLDPRSLPQDDEKELGEEE